MCDSSLIPPDGQREALLHSRVQVTGELEWESEQTASKHFRQYKYPQKNKHLIRQQCPNVSLH